MNFDFIQTGAELSVGTSYAVGSLAPLPYSAICVPITRTDGGNAVGSLHILTNGDVLLCPLTTIPSGVNLATCVTYFYQ